MTKRIQILKLIPVLFLFCGNISINADEINKDYFLLITGCGRSGTTYMATLLSHCGLDIQHERLGKDGIVSWFMAVQSDEDPESPHLTGYRFKHIFHQVRNPLDVITSFLTNNINNQEMDFVSYKIPEIKKEERLIVKAAKYWYYWNLEAEKIAEWRYRIEDIDTIFSEMSARLGFYLPESALADVSKKTNTWKPIVEKITWHTLKNNLSTQDFLNLQNLAKKYGYSIYDSPCQAPNKFRQTWEGKRKSTKRGALKKRTSSVIG